MNDENSSETRQKPHADVPGLEVFNDTGAVIPTQRMRALQALAESESRYRALIETTGTGFVIIDSTGVVLDANDEYVRLTGRASRDEIVGKNVLQWTAPYEREKNRSAVKTCADKGYLRDFELDYSTPDGTIIPIELNATVVEFNGRRQILTLCRDISSRRKIERKIQESEELFRKAFEDGPHGMLLSDSEHRIVVANAAFCKMIGYDETELLGRKFSEIIHPGQLREVTDNIDLRDQGKFHINKIETRYLKKNGETLWASVTVCAIRDAEEKFLSNLAMVEDITERKRTEETLHSAQKLESLGVLAGGIAHDFNNLLGGLFGNLDLARLLLQEGNYSQTHETICRAIGVFERAKSLTAQLLTFSRGGSPQRRPIAPGPLIKDTVSFALSGSNAKSTFSLPPDLWTCHLDENQIGQVIDNIAINAQQAMPQGGTLSVFAENVDIREGDHALLRQGPYVKVCFSDTGIGIPAEIQKRIFDPFFSTKQKGSGLGLATAYSIVTKHEGAIDVNSQPGKGATFSLYLPAVPQASQEPCREATEPFRGSGTILVMDDERFILEVASKMVAMMGFTPLTAASGDEAIQKVREAHAAGTTIRAAILDLTIPGGKGGRECVGELLAIDPAIKAIVSSGYNDDPVMAEPQRYGFSGRLKKPYEMSGVVQVLRELLESKQG